MRWTCCGSCARTLVLTDLVMPGVDGVGLLRAIRGDARWASLLVVALTTSDEAAALARVRDAGFDGQLTKPVASRRRAAYVGAARAARR